MNILELYEKLKDSYTYKTDAGHKLRPNKVKVILPLSHTP